MTSVKILDNYQSPKKISPISDRYEENDTRFCEYADALKAGDLDTCAKLRAKSMDDQKIICKFGMLERIWLKEMSHYVREVQIVRRERDGWQNVAIGYQKKLQNDKTPPTSNTMIQRGKKLLQQAIEARELHVEVEIPSGFVGV